MSIGARPLGPDGVRAVIERKVRDFAHVARSVRIRYLPIEPFLEAVRDDPDVRLALETGYIGSLEDDHRDPVVVFPDDRLLLTCPPLAAEVLADEPPEIHRAFVEGTFFRKLFRFFVPAHHEGGARWEETEQVREIMQRHFAFQLIVTEQVLGQAS